MTPSSSPSGITSIDQPAGTLDVISMPASLPVLTPGLARALVRLIRNSEGAVSATVTEIDGERHPRALAS